ncbi:GFA family protein [Roseibacterium sp. SDUM158016]|uniref:GFA family protein n=1 Tax=Roseicyclus sediminis TaxID=2980997 RepID=UPI0021D26D8B|nr:GFA family protein [Roseibacterium sp. SDUM158016]MCU4654464.1 GFA family protein [Roseibacterium sp. SDUM158016]
MSKHQGSCACGAVRIEAGADPAIVSMCHCLQCQKRTGSTYSVHAYWPREEVSVTGGRTAYRRAGDTGCYITFRFCPQCSSTTDWDVEAMLDLIGVPVGLFADPAFPPPTTSIFVPHKHGWVVIPEGVPQNEGHGAAFLDAAAAALARRTEAGS